MPSFSALTPADMDGLMAFLANPAAGAGGGGRAAPLVDPPSLGGPVVATGPAPASVAGNPAGAADAVKLTRSSAGMSRMSTAGNGGNVPYPDGVTAPEARFNSPWSVSYNASGPPWSTITAYDLNKGTIKWQVPAGDDLAMLAEGVHDTGSRQLRTGIIPTATGLVFQVGGDRESPCLRRRNR